MRQRRAARPVAVTRDNAAAHPVPASDDATREPADIWVWFNGATRTRVTSRQLPAPSAEITGTPRRWQDATSAALQAILSIQSAT